MIDVDKIKAKLASLRRENKGNGDHNWRWRSGEGNHKVRLLPWPDSAEDPIKVLYFYFGIKPYGILAPAQFDKPDPVKEFQTKLYKEGTDEAKEIAKKLYSKPRAFVPVIVRDEEDKGVRIWEFNPNVAEQIYEMFLDKEIGAINDFKTGRDLKIKVSKPAGKKFAEIKVTPSMEKTVLSADKEQVKTWTSSIPSLNDKFTPMSYDELKKTLDDWFNGNEPDASTDGTEKGGDKKSKTDMSSEFDDVFEQLNKEIESDDD